MFKVVVIILLLIVLFLVQYKQSDMYNDELVIITSHFNEDLEWLKSSPWRVVVCDKPGASPSAIDVDPVCTLNVNKGREASSYLKYIVENYDNLPERMVFIHGHEESKHQRHPKGIIEAIKEAKIHDYDFISLNNWIHAKHDPVKSPVIPDRPWNHNSFEKFPAPFEELHKTWADVFAPLFGPDVPAYFRFDSSAQFIVSRQAVHRHGKHVYQRLYEFTMDPVGDEWARGAIMEMIWHMLFTDSGNDICDNHEDKDLYKNCTDEVYYKTRFNS